MFTTTIRLAQRYLSEVVDGGKPPTAKSDLKCRDLAIEIVERLRQLNFIIKRTHQLESEADDENRYEELMLECKTQTEAFYFIADRIRCIVRDGDLPKLKKFKADGVRDVRNHLLQHPEGKSSRVFIQSFGWRGLEGPTLKVLRYSGSESIFPDRGLYKNAEEFKAGLETVLTGALAKVSA